MPSVSTDTSMRVLQLGPYPPPHGGVQSNLVAIHRYLLDAGLSAQVVNITRHRKREEGGVYYPKSWLELLWLLARLRYDIIHLHVGGNVTVRLLGLSLLCCSIPGRKAVLTLHSGGYPSSREGRRARPRSLGGFVFRRFDRIIAVNPEIERLFQRFGVNPAKVRLIEPHALPPALPEGNMPEAHGRFFETHDPVLVTVSGLEPEYDVPLQVEALGSVLDRHPKAGLVVIGSGSIEGELRALIARTPYRSHILLGGDVAHDEAMIAVHASDLFLRTSRYDGDSIAVREALHLGVPVIATDTGMRPPGVHLIPMSNAAALANEIEELLSRPEGERRIGRATDENIAAVVDLYRELMREMGKSR
jgi:glycosyltransferase involved in cell wall biosynthesis